MSDFPNTIRVKVIDSKNNKPIANIAVGITLFATHKNDYGFILPFTDRNGISEVNRNWLDKQIILTKDSALMDYSSDLEHCKPRFLIEIMSEEEVKRAVNGHKIWQKAFNITDEYIDLLSKVDNYKYLKTSKLVELTGEQNIEIEFKIEKLS
jgi:hypothetical protein